MTSLHFVIGGARSGKSRYAEELAREAEQRGQLVVLVATALAGDAEMADRIARHRAERPAHWQVREVPMGSDTALADVLQEAAQPGAFVVVDCLTLWLSQLMCPPPAAKPGNAQGACEALMQSLRNIRGPVVLVSNEIGLGVVPADATTRAVVDTLGRLHQDVAALADRVSWVVAGIPVLVKGPR